MAAVQLNLTSYHLTFDDEFNSFSSSPSGSATQWATTAFGLRTLPANAEQEYYSDSTVGVNPFSLQNGVLTITAKPGSNPLGLPYNSGEITTAAMFSQSTGYFVMRAELPAGKGMWPAFWLMPENQVPGEIDAMEAFGAPAPDGEGGVTTYHWGMHAPDGAAGSDGNWVSTGGANITTGYHTYGVDVETDYTTYYFDGAQVAQIATPTGLGNQPLYMIANLAVGGSWPGSPNGETAQMKIDYIRAYAKNPVSPTGATITLDVYGRAYAGIDPQFTVKVDGVQQGGTYTATAKYGQGGDQFFISAGNWSTGTHDVQIAFVNPGGTGATARALGVNSISFNSVTENVAGYLTTASTPHDLTVGSSVATKANPMMDKLIVTATGAGGKLALTMDGVSFSDPTGLSALLMRGNWAKGSHDLAMTASGAAITVTKVTTGTLTGGGGVWTPPGGNMVIATGTTGHLNITF